MEFVGREDGGHVLSPIMYSGVEFPWVPETGDVPLVCDASSSFLTHKMDISKVRGLRGPDIIAVGASLHLER